jgi:hypothetical protein
MPGFRFRFDFVLDQHHKFSGLIARYTLNAFRFYIAYIVDDRSIPIHEIGMNRRCGRARKFLLTVDPSRPSVRAFWLCHRGPLRILATRWPALSLFQIIVVIRALVTLAIVSVFRDCTQD